MYDGLAFFIDRGMGSRIVPDGLRAAGWRVVTMDERYGVATSQEVADVDWIADASGRGEILLCKDRKIAKRPLEAAAIAANRSRVIVITDAQITAPEMLKRLLDNAGRIEQAALHGEAPWVVSVSSDGIRRIRLNA